MGQNHDTPIPTAMSLSDALHKLENAIADTDNLGLLCNALAASGIQLEPSALYPVADALKRARLDLDAATTVLFAEYSGPRKPAVHPDAELIALCAEHGRNRVAFNRDAERDGENGPLWAAYERTRNAIGAAEPQTIEGAVAKARAAIEEAGGESHEGSPASDWAWQLVHDLVRLHGGRPAMA